MPTKKNSEIKPEITVVLIKPDGVKRKIVGEIITRFEKIGLKLTASKLIWVDSTHAGKHYADDNEYHKTVGVKTLENYKKYGLDVNENLGTKDPVEIGKIVRKWNMEMLSAGPVMAMIWQGPPGTVELVRKVVGYTFPFDALPGTIRGDYGFDSYYANLEKRTADSIVHASGNVKEAEFERKLWFRENEIYEY